MRHTIILFLILSSLQTFAQPEYSPEVTAKKETQWLQTNLNLNDSQTNKVSVINLSYNRSINSIMKSPDKQEREKKLLAADRKKDEEMKPILNQEQYKKYLIREQQLKAQEKARNTGRHRPE